MNVKSPIVIDLGKTRDENVDQLRIGAGPIVEDLEEVMRLVRLNAGAEGEKRIFLPVVTVYGRK
jgi:hypothetical protein